MLFKMLAQILFWGRWGQGLTDISADKFEVSSTCSNIHSEKLKWWRKKLWLGCGDIGGAKELPNHRVECIWNDARLGSFTPKLAAVLLEEKVSKVEGKPVEVRFPFVFPLEWKATFTMYDDEVVYGHKLHKTIQATAWSHRKWFGWVKPTWCKWVWTPTSRNHQTGISGSVTTTCLVAPHLLIPTYPIVFPSHSIFSRFGGWCAATHQLWIERRRSSNN